ncbi:DUF2189 domain-containing protein, partial [Thermomonas sp.]|uniref:DUF2189 domain-containing protein n=1 Tax=Thermomonas sp. TaxID=1971895 RepID=UPI00391C6E9B
GSVALMTSPSATPPDAPTPRPFVVPCRRLGMDAPWRWLRLGWRDLRRAPGLSLLFGALIVAVSLLVSALAWWLGRFALLATLLSGFVFVAPMLAVGLYCVSRGLERGETPRLRQSFSLARRVAGQAGIYALGQGVVILLWSRAGMMLNALWPIEQGDRLALLEYLTLGSGVGAVFATVTFAISAFSLPMVADRDVDMVTACVSSVNAVLRNKPVMLLWAALLVAITVLAFATAFLGLAVAMPWLAYATWHAYRDTLNPEGWPALD